MDFQLTILSNYQKCKEAPDNLKAELLFSIIQLKSIKTSCYNLEQSIYCDIKSFIIAYITSIENRDYGYDKINTQKFITAVKASSNSKEKYELLLFLNRLLSKHGLQEECKNLKCELNIAKKQVILDFDSGFKKWMRLLLHYTSYNVSAIILTLIIVYLVSTILFLPTNNINISLFSITYDHYSNNHLVNHFLNTLGGVFGIKDEFKVIPINPIGLSLLVLFKLFYIIFIINYLYKRSLEIIQL